MSDRLQIIIPITLFYICLLGLPLFVSADTYEPLTASIPGMKEAAEIASTGNFTELINTIYKLSIALSIALAVIILVIEGVRYSASAIPGVKSDIKERIALVFGGLILLIGAYMFLALINPIQLVNFGDLGKNNILPSNVGVGVVTDATDPTILDGVEFESGKTGEEVMQEISELSWQETREIVADKTDLGITIDSGGTIAEGDYSPVSTITVSEEGQRIVAAAIKLCSDIPESWASNTDLYKLIAKESNGKIGLLNHKFDDYRKHAGLTYGRIASDIRGNSFYYQHCCRVTKQSTREARENGIQTRCNPNTQSPFIDHAGDCFSSAGIGQLTVANMAERQPSGVQGFGDTYEEICGMLRYIKYRPNYGTPGAALQFHLENNWY
ncbi:MAG: pilin [Patescibacteria group bacterium]